MVAVEAISACIPVVAAAKGGMKEYLIDGENAIVIEAYDNFAETAKEKILELFDSDLSYRDKIVKNARNTVKSRFDWFEIAAETELLYHEMA